MCLRTEMVVYRGELNGWPPKKIDSPREHCTNSKLFTSDKKM